MHKLVSHEYFMDEMHIIDICIMTKFIEYSDVLEWNHTRQLMLCQLKPYLKRKDMTAQELFPLPTDEDNSMHSDKHTTEMSNEEVEWYKNFIKNKKKGSK